jgi:hypothetical protein
MVKRGELKRRGWFLDLRFLSAIDSIDETIAGTQSVDISASAIQVAPFVSEICLETFSAIGPGVGRELLAGVRGIGR